jgi:hypothetical protein
VKHFLYKYAELIFWVIIGLDLLGFATANYLSALQSLPLIFSYFIYRGLNQDRWFCTYLLGLALAGAMYFLYVSGYLRHQVSVGIIDVALLGLATCGIFYFFGEKKLNKPLAWVSFYFAAFLILTLNRILLPARSA